MCSVAWAGGCCVSGPSTGGRIRRRRPNAWIASCGGCWRRVPRPHEPACRLFTALSLKFAGRDRAGGALFRSGRHRIGGDRRSTVGHRRKRNGRSVPRYAAAVLRYRPKLSRTTAIVDHTWEGGAVVVSIASGCTGKRVNSRISTSPRSISSRRYASTSRGFVNPQVKMSIAIRPRSA